MEPLREIQRRMTTRRIKPEEFKDRIIFMSMHNDIHWSKGEEMFDECFSNSLKDRLRTQISEGTLVISRSW